MGYEVGAGGETPVSSLPLFKSESTAHIISAATSAVSVLFFMKYLEEKITHDPKPPTKRTLRKKERS
jgi:hypothetical protein